MVQENLNEKVLLEISVPNVLIVSKSPRLKLRMLPDTKESYQLGDRGGCCGVGVLRCSFC